MTTPIADPRAVEAAEKFSGITQEHVATWGNSTLVRNARACRKEGFLAGWEARSAAGPATREQGSVDEARNVANRLAMILENSTFKPVDHACGECMPLGTIIRAGFVCVYHKAKSWGTNG